MAKPKFDIIEEVLTIELNGKDYEVDLARVSRLMIIDPVHLDEELQEQAAFYFWISTLATQAEIFASDAKHEFEIWFADVVSESREKLSKKAEGKAPAATIIEASAKGDPEYQERLEELSEIQRNAALLGTVRDAVRMRQYLLIERSKRLSRDEAAEAQE